MRIFQLFDRTKESIKAIAFLLIFFMSLFSILAVNLWGYELDKRCRTTE